jgi:hypothetical protein
VQVLLRFEVWRVSCQNCIAANHSTGHSCAQRLRWHCHKRLENVGQILPAAGEIAIFIIIIMLPIKLPYCRNFGNKCVPMDP